MWLALLAFTLFLAGEQQVTSKAPEEITYRLLFAETRSMIPQEPPWVGVVVYVERHKLLSCNRND